MKRSPGFLFIVIPLVLLIILLVGPWKPWERNKMGVVLSHVEDVDRIVLLDPYNTAELRRKNDTWYLFGNEKVSPVTVENLLIAASRLEVSSIVDNESFTESGASPEEIRELTFFKGDKVLLSYELKAMSGKYVLHPHGSPKAYYVALPGYPGLNLERVFSATPDHYREHLLIDLLPSDISAIEIELASGEAFRFTQDTEGKIRCNPLNENTILPQGEPNELAVKLLFSYFTSIRYEQRTSIPADSLNAVGASCQRMASIRVESFGGDQHLLKVFPYRENQNSQADLFRALVLYNDEQEALLLNYIYLDVLMRGLSHYFGEK